jgi:diguanylate cyclase (GGDEF)-like protein
MTPGGDAGGAVATPGRRTAEAAETRGWGLSIVVWLVLGFVVVIAAFVTGAALAKRGTHLATDELLRVQSEMEPLTRTARELGESAAAFERAVLSFLGTDSDGNRAKLVSAGERLARAVNEAPSQAVQAAGSSAVPLAEDIAGFQALGFELAALRAARQSSINRMDAAYQALARRVSAGGAAGIRVGETVLTRPDMQELADALDAARDDALHDVDAGEARPLRETPGESGFRATLGRHDAALRRSPGAAWLSLVEEDFAVAIRMRRSANTLRGEIESRRAQFTATGEALAARVREEYEAPAWNRIAGATSAAAQAVQRAEEDITDAMAKAALAALLVLVITTVLVTRPIRRLTEGAQRLAAGDLSARVRRGGAREVDELSRAFNRMASELDDAERAVRRYQSQLEQRVTERTQQLKHLAEHDPLTNLPNRRQLLQHLNDLIDRATPAGTRLAVMFLDLDNFKSVNDSLGHEFGDRVLTEIGERMRQITGEAGFIARLGGDEFTLVFPYSGDSQEVERRAEQLVNGFKRPLTIDHRDVSVGVSCGVAMFPEHGRDATSLLRAADAALFRAKELGRNRLCFHEPSMLVDASNRFRIEQALRRAIDGGDFVLHYQPQVCLGIERANSAEALLRWRRSDTEIIPASEFVQVAEHAGLMLDLNDWVLENAASAVRTWRDSGWPDARVAVNVSAQQFMAGDFLSVIERLLARHSLPPDALELELTEGMLQTGAITVEPLHALRALGVTTALDDFGTGFSSLTSLDQLPLSRVKLDRRLIAEVDHNSRAASIARSIIVLCRNLGLAVTAEGVERHEQLDFLASCGDVSVQGYLVSRPVDSGSVVDFARESTTWINYLLRAGELSRPPRYDGDLNGAVSLARRQRR